MIGLFFVFLFHADFGYSLSESRKDAKFLYSLRLCDFARLKLEQLLTFTSQNLKKRQFILKKRQLRNINYFILDY
jgi:hypothetical protein